MNMTQISNCDMESCTYNMDGLCHTLAITVGPHAECNTYIHGSAKGGFNDANGGIGSCLAADCRFNERLECRAPEIDVSSHEKHADCETYEEQ